jgi:PAS domain S-box-containing protein
VFFWVLSPTGPSLAAEKLKLVVGGDHENPPYEFLENGKPTGFNVELMRAAAETIGAEVEFRLGPWGKVREELEAGKIDALAGMYYSVERSKAVDFSVPHTMVSAGLFVRGDSQVRSIDDIKGKEVIVQNGDVIDDYLREMGIASRLIEVKDPADELRLLSSGRHDAALMPSRFQGEYLKRSLGISNVKGMSVNLPQFRYCFAVKKGNDPLRFRLDEGLNILKVNGGYQEIYRKWFGVYEESRLWRTVRYFAWALAAVAGLLAASSIWSWFLRREVRKKTAELRERDESLRFTQYAVDNTIDQAFWMTEGGQIFYVNDAACRALGYTREELQKLSIPDIDPIYQPEKFAEHWRDLQENGHATFETVHRAKDGRVYPVEIRANHVVFDGKEYNCAFATEITERKRMGKELQQAHDELEKRVLERTEELSRTTEALIAAEQEKSLFLNITDAIVIYYDTEMTIHWANRAAGDSVNMPPEELEKRHCWEMWHQRKEPCTGCPVVLARDTGEPQEAEIRSPDGRVWYIHGYPVRDETGRLIGMVEFCQDFSERKRLEEALRESESRVRSKLESILDPEGDIGELDLADIIDAPGIQALMDDLYRNTGLKMSIIDIKGRVLVDVGWQDICLKYHRGNPETVKKCLESDTILTEGVPRGWFRRYRCRNNMWHLVTPIIVGGRHMGNLFMGQFFYENEEIDYDLFRSQAREYGFPEEEYMAALEAVPRHSEECINKGKAFFLRLIDMFSKLSYGNIKLARSLAERDRLTETVRQANMVVENSPVVLFRWKGDDEWPVELVSANIIQFGYAPDEFLSGAITYSAIIHPDDLERVTREVHDSCIEGADQFRLEYRIVTKGGDIRWVNELTNVERDPERRVKNFEGVVIDITERRKAEEQLILQQIQLRELNSTLEERVREEVAKNREKDFMLIQQNRQAALGEILDHIAHQWKQPLNSISLITYMLMGNDSLSRGEINETADKILGQVNLMSQTLNVFRDFYRPDKEKSVFLIKENIDGAVSFIKHALQLESIKVEVEADPELSALGYPKEFAQVLLNLLSNALDAFKEKKVENPKLIIRGIAEGNMAVVTVTDNAGGINEQAMANIFELNFTTKESSGGTGIGLYMSKNIIERHMGGILTAGNIADGAQFSIKLGIAAAAGNTGP